MKWLGNRWHVLPRPRLAWAIANVVAIVLLVPLMAFMILCDRLIPARRA